MHNKDDPPFPCRFRRRLGTRWKPVQLSRRSRGGGWYAGHVLAVPLGLFVFLVQIAVGGAIVQAFLDWLEPDISSGYFELNHLFFLLFGGAGLALRAYLPAARMLPYDAGVPWIDLEVWAWGAFLASVAVAMVLLRARQRARATRAGFVTAAVGLGAIVTTALADAPPSVDPSVTVASLVLGSLALGTSWNGMMLGHWYLNTPRLAPRPLVRLNLSMAAVLLVQGAFVTFVAVALLPHVLESWVVWVRLGVGLLAPLLLAIPAHLTARVRSMMSATGLLYIALGAILAGELVARLYLFVGQAPL